MQQRTYRFHITAAVIMGLFSFAVSADISIGQPAPAFQLVDQYRKPHRLVDYRGNWLVLYFYPKDDTPGCTTEACHFRDDIFHIRELGAEVLGVSLDSAESHARFAEKHGLPFPLLADAGGEVSEAYGSLWQAGPLRYARRHTFIIDPDGRIAEIYRQVKPGIHSQEIIDKLKVLQAGR